MSKIVKQFLKCGGKKVVHYYMEIVGLLTVTKKSRRSLTHICLRKRKQYSYDDDEIVSITTVTQ